MSKKMMLLATALTALAFAALPAVASAGTPETHCPNGAASCAIDGSGGFSSLSKTSTSLKIHCSSFTAKGSMTTTGGSIQITFHGCTDSLFGFACSSAGHSSGTITTTTLPYDNRYTADNKTSPGVLITPAAGTSHFASFTCADGAHTVSGNGVMGSLGSPGCGGSAASLALSFSQSSNGHQAQKQITGTGTIFDLTEGGNTAAQVGSGTIKATGGGNISITCP